MKVDFLNMEREANQLVKNGLMDDLQNVILSGQYLFGPKSEELEDKLSELLNSNVVLVGSGTDALYLSLKAFRIGPGYTVAIPTVSAIPTAIAVKMTGADIEYIDVDPKTMLMNSSQLEKSLDYVSAVIPVHLYGNVVNINSIMEICNRHNIPVIEDCAQCFGAKSNYGKYTGTMGNIGAFSLYPSKNLGAYGDAGFIATNNVDLSKTIKELRFYGQKDRYSVGNVGMNSRIDEIQSTILLKKLDIFYEIEQKRLSLYQIYTNMLRYWTVEWSKFSMPHVYPIFVKNRKRFIRKMNECGVSTAIHYPFILPQIIDKINKRYDSEDLVNRVVSIPFNPWMTDEEVNYVLERVQQHLEY